ncbi:hypothetical protein TWF694_000293 [Orbilia ellipsospora]|uniref:Uncharacterized protein n=1 Tax=Orbilia ellipsospora TaxID=2528407 RepID=A0AAV9XN57_9PEZI
MSAGTPSKLSTLTRNGAVIVLVPNIKTEQVPATSQAVGQMTSSKIDQISLATLLSSSSLVPSSSIVTPQTPTTLLTTTRPNGPPVVVVTQYLTITTPASTPIGTSAVWTRPGETQPAGPPFPLGPYYTSQGKSPLETGGVHLPQPEFNGLAASPGVIVGTFGAIFGVGIICFVYCMIKRQRLQKLLNEENKQSSGPPVLPPVNRQPDSPVWFTCNTNSIELKNLPTNTATSMSAPSASTYRGSSRYQGRQGVLDVAGTQHDPHGDILTTGGGTVFDPKDDNHQHEINKASKGIVERQNQGGFTNEDEDSIGLAFTKPETAVERGPFPVSIEEVEEEMKEAQAINVPGAPFLLSELEDTSDRERYHTFIK